MANVVRVVPENLLLSAGHVEAHAGDIAARHGAALGRIAAAQKGQVGRSAVAVAAAAARWQTVSAALQARMADHSRALHTSGLVFEATDQDSAARLDGIGDGPSARDL